MPRGLNKYEGKDKRRQRMKNHIAKDLRTGTKYHQRVLPDRKKYFMSEDEGEYYFDDKDE